MSQPTSILRPVVLPPELLGRPAPCDLYNAGGVLLLRAGALIAGGRDGAEPLRFHCAAEFAGTLSSADPTLELARIAAGLAEIAQRAAAGAPVSASELACLARATLTVWLSDPDACLGLARLSRFALPSVRHPIHVALLALEAGAAGGVPAGNLETLAGAALSMNLTSLALHERMFNLCGAPDDEQRLAIAAHPAASAAVLRLAGRGPGAARLADWASAVSHHHENIDGSGYPGRLKGAAIPLSARILRVADTLAARLSGRRLRAPLYWNLNHAGNCAALTQHVFGADLARVDKSVVNQLMRALGAFPPGSMVRLSNGELALVTRRSQRSGRPRQVLAIADGLGRPLEAPLPRRIAFGVLAIRAYAQDEANLQHGQVWKRAWGYGE